MTEAIRIVELSDRRSWTRVIVKLLASLMFVIFIAEESLAADPPKNIEIGTVNIKPVNLPNGIAKNGISVRRR